MLVAILPVGVCEQTGLEHEGIKSWRAPAAGSSEEVEEERANDYHQNYQHQKRRWGRAAAQEAARKLAPSVPGLTWTAKSPGGPRPLAI